MKSSHACWWMIDDAHAQGERLERVEYSCAMSICIWMELAVRFTSFTSLWHALSFLLSRGANFTCVLCPVVVQI